MRASGTHVLRRVCWTALLSVCVAQAHALEQEVAPPNWDREALSLFASIPIQDGGRIKPLDTYARFKLLQLSGKTSLRLAQGKRTALEWLLDSLFYPELARHYDVFLVESAEIMDAMGLPHRKKRDRYSYDQLEVGFEHLFSLVDQFIRIDEKDRSPAQNQTIHLAVNVREFEALIHFFDFARQPVPVRDSAVLARVFPGAEHVTYSAILNKGPVLSGLVFSLRSAEEGIDESKRAAELEALTLFLHDTDALANRAAVLALFPPSGSSQDEPQWLSPGDLTASAFLADKDLTEQIALVRSLEELYETKGDRDRFRETLVEFQSGIRRLAERRGEYSRIPLEVTFYKARFFQHALMLYILSFLLVAISWFWPRSRPIAFITALTVLIPTGLLICGITFRCIIRARPPVTTLYETILFITAVAAAVALITEYINRQKIAISVGSLLGTLGLFLANKYEVQEGVDTMPSLIAVLDTNFWLSTHVTTITIGYAAGLLAGALAHVFILGKAVGFKKSDPGFYDTVTRMTYGTICFGLLFSTLGTVLGGIWANESWGRFWGWDPKENGALMIVLWELAILHAWMGRYIRDYGINMAAVFGAVIVAFSWFGVNLLGVGLHSYGFTSGIFRTLLIFYVVEAVILFVGGIAWLREKGVIALNLRQGP